MKAEFWHRRWKKNEIGFHQQEINSHLQEFWRSLSLAAGQGVFVPLCGKSRDMLWLRAQGHPVLGVELSPIAVRDFFAENGLEAQIRPGAGFDRWEADSLVLLCGDFFDLKRAHLAACAAVYDRASLVALSPELRSRYARRLRELLPPGAGVLLVTMEYSQEEMEGPPFSVREDEVRELFAAEWAPRLLYDRDILQENPRFGARGLSALREKVYLLRAPGPATDERG